MREFIEKNNNIVFKMLFDGILIGILSGILSVLYRYIISKMDFLRSILFSNKNTFNIVGLLILFFVFSVIISKLLKWAPLSGGSGIPQIRAEILGKFNMDEKKTIISKTVGGGLCDLAGLSLGREGPSIQMGGAIAKLLGKALKRDSSEINYLITAGAGAGLAAAFNAPIAGTLFVIEELHKSYSKFLLIPTLIASVIANFVSFGILGHRSSFSFIVENNLPLKFMWVCLIIGLLTGIVGVTFNLGIVNAQKLYRSFNVKMYIKIFVLMIFATFIGYNFFEITGGGHNLMENLAITSYPIKYLVLILALKLIYTCLSYGSGVQGGIFLPTLVIGGLSGIIVYSLLKGSFDLSPYYVNFIILGMSGILASVVRVPILAVMLVTEMTGSFNHLMGLCIVVIISYSVAELLKNPPIYDSLFEGQLKAHGVDEFSKIDSRFSIYEYSISDLSPIINQSIRDINFPNHLIIIKILRNDLEFIPKADDLIKPGDKLTVLARKKDYLDIDEFFKTEVIS